MKIRQSNYELMRIVSMLLIVLYHILSHGQVLHNTTGVMHLIVIFLLCITMVHVNSFVMLTGYFNYNKTFSIKKFFKTFNMMWFYQVAIIIVLTICGYDIISGKYQLINDISPLNNSYWFVTTYLILYILSPYLNRLIEHLSQKEYRRFIIVLLILYSFIPFITKGDIIYNIGSSIAHFCVLYFIGAYLAKYPISENYHFKLYSKNKLQLIMFLGFTCSILLNFGVFNLGTFFKSFGNQFLIDLGNSFALTISTYSLPFTLLQTIFYFLWFGTLNIKSKIINLIGPLTFGVYLIHDNDFIRPWLYKFLEINNGSVITSYTIFIRIIICTFIIFIVCAFVEFIRQKIFKFIENRKISRTISKLFYKYINNF